MLQLEIFKEGFAVTFQASRILKIREKEQIFSYKVAFM